MQAGVPSQVLRAVLGTLEPGPPSTFHRGVALPGRSLLVAFLGEKSHTKGACAFAPPFSNISRIALSEMMAERERVGIRSTDRGARGDPTYLALGHNGHKANAGQFRA